MPVEKVNAIDITDMSNRQIEDLIQDSLVELQERQNAEYYQDAICHGILVQECTLNYRQGYIEWLKGAGAHHPKSAEILDAWEDYCDQEERKESMRNTGA